MRPVPGPHLARLLAELHALLTPPAPVPLEQWRAEVAAEWIARGSARSTRTRMSQALTESTAPFPGGTTADLTTGLVARLAARRGRAATTNGLLSSLRAACGFAVSRGWVDAGALAGACWRVPDDPPRRRHHGRAEIARVLESLRLEASSWEGHRLYALAATLAYTGLRRNEALRLRVADVDCARGFVFVAPPPGGRLKTLASAAPVPMPLALARILGPWLACCGSPWLFPGVRGRGPWTGGTTGKTATARLVRVGRAAGVEGFTPQSLRHSLATHLRGWWGLSPAQVRLVLRHTTEATQAHYVHPDLANLGELVRGFDFTDAPPPPRRPGRHAWRRRPRPRHTVAV